MYLTARHSPDSPLKAVDDRRQGSRSADLEANAFIDHYTSLADAALKDEEDPKVVSIGQYAESAKTTLKEKRRRKVG